MAVLSHFRVAHPEELLACLLCQGNEILSKIIGIAEQIDPSLRDGIMGYIHGLKGTNDKKNHKVDDDSHCKFEWKNF